MKLGQWIKGIVKIQPGKPVSVAIPLTRPVAISLIVIVICVIGWAFFMGWMVGAGQNPEAGFAKLTGLHPKPAENAEVAENISQEAPVSEIPPENAEPDNAADASQFQRPKGEQLDAWPDSRSSQPKPPAAPAATQGKTKPAQQKRPPENRTKKQDIYNYTYQVAAFKTSKETERLIATLKRAGIRAGLKKSGKVFLVLATLRGSDADARALTEKLAAMKLGKPLQLARKPVAGGGKK